MIDIDELCDALRPETRLVSLMHANNEIGSLLPLAEVGEQLRRSAAPECVFHVDAAQTVGKIAINLAELEVDLLSLSAHKFYGPKGVGALYVRRSTTRNRSLYSSRRPSLKLPPLCLGGHQERGIRPGTLATHQIVGLGVAAQEAIDDLNQGGDRHLRSLTHQLYQGLTQLDPSARRRSPELGAPHVLSVTLGAELLEHIEDRWSHIAFSRGSACHSTSNTPSHVLLALGLTSEEASRTVRFGLGRSTTPEDVSEALQLLKSI
jgi:cysteine desulfurase